MKPTRGVDSAPPKLAADATAVDLATEAMIAGYLTAHPDFVQRHPALLRTMIPPDADRGQGVVDFQRYMVAKLQSDVELLGLDKTTLIHNARANNQNQSRIHNAALALIEARSLGQMLEVLTGDLAVMLDVDVVAMVVESNGTDVPHTSRSGIRITEPGAVANWIGRRDVVLQGGVTGDPAIYGPGAGLIQSEALLRLNISQRTPVGLVAFGSRDPTLFQEGQGTEMIGFLGAVLERLLRGWLELPA